MRKAILKVEKLFINFNFNNLNVQAVDNSSFEIFQGECLSIVGESGSGKSVTALSIMKLLQENSKTKINGNIIFTIKFVGFCR